MFEKAIGITTVGVAIGWGKAVRHPNAQPSEILQKADIPLQKQEVCKAEFGGVHPFGRRSICAGTYNHRHVKETQEDLCYVIMFRLV